MSDGSTFTVPTSSQTEGDIINFLDNGVKVRCVLNWDTDGDNQLSKAEAAAVTSLEGVFTECVSIIAFDELKYYIATTPLKEMITNLKSAGYSLADIAELLKISVLQLSTIVKDDQIGKTHQLTEPIKLVCSYLLDKQFNK